LGTEGVRDITCSNETGPVVRSPEDDTDRMTTASIVPRPGRLRAHARWRARVRLH
jgi:hypothetical protein